MKDAWCRCSACRLAGFQRLIPTAKRRTMFSELEHFHRRWELVRGGWLFASRKSQLTFLFVQTVYLRRLVSSRPFWDVPCFPPSVCICCRPSQGHPKRLVYFVHEVCDLGCVSRDGGPSLWDGKYWRSNACSPAITATQSDVTDNE